MGSPAPGGFRLGAVILAAGASSRMGTPKQLLDGGGAPLVARAVDAATAAGADPVIVVVGAHAGDVRSCLASRDAVPVPNEGWEEGMASSVRVGVCGLLQRAPEIDAVLLAPCDQPGLTERVIRSLSALCRETGMTSCARYDGRNGAPAVFARADLHLLQGLQGDQGARGILNSGSERIVALDFPDLGLDLDTPEDYRSWKARQGEGRKS